MSHAKLAFCFLIGLANAQAQNPTPPQPVAPASLSTSIPPPQTPTPPSDPDPAITQIRKAVTFIKMSCNDGTKEWDVRGTGFFVFYPEPRLGPDHGFIYLVTNRHVAECWNESNKPMRVDSIVASLNRRQPEGGVYLQEASLTPNGGNAAWVLPEDGSVDLAALPVLPDAKTYDYKTLPLDIFASDDLVKKWRVTEGESVFFTGFFYQFQGTKRIEPIVRQGTIAMMPQDKVPFVGFSARVYLADLHVFGGNSGSPAFINLGGFRQGNISTGEDYRLLGVVNGTISEDENFNLELATTVKGKAAANSGVSTIIPASEVRLLLDDPKLQKIRDAAVEIAKRGAGVAATR